MRGDRFRAVPVVAAASLPSLSCRGTTGLAPEAPAEDALGESRAIRDIHHRVLDNGALPLSMLRQHLERWIAIRRNGKRRPKSEPTTPQPTPGSLPGGCGSHWRLPSLPCR
jgi:hypothetical protein